MNLFRALLILPLAVILLTSCSEDSTNEPQRVTLSGVIQKASDGTVLGGADVIALRHENGEELTRTMSDSTGGFTLYDLPAVMLDLRIEAQGFAPVLMENLDPAQSIETLRNLSVTMSDQEECCDGVLNVIVRDPQNQPIMGALVRVWKDGAIHKKTTTDSSGIAVLQGLCGGEYGVDVTKDGWTDREFTFSINANCDPVTKEVTMEQLACCEGVFTLIVRDGNGNPVEGAKVQVRKGMNTLEDPRTDANGRIVVDGLCKGEYNYRVSKEGYNVVEGLFSINANCDPVTKEATLENKSGCCTGVLTVTVVDSTATPIQNAVVKLWKNGVLLEKQLTGNDGKAVFDQLCAGSFGVDVEKVGLKGREFMFSINENCDPYSKTIELMP